MASRVIRFALGLGVMVACVSATADGAVKPRVFNGAFETQPGSAVQLVVKKGAVRFRTSGVQLTCADGTTRPDGVNGSFVKARLRDSGVFKRAVVSNSQFGAVYRYAFRGRISNGTATGVLYESQQQGTIGVSQPPPDCWTPASLRWNASM